MKKFLFLFALCLFGFLISCESCKSKYADEITRNNVKFPVPLGDPFILLDDGIYYAYGTHSDSGIEVYTSEDLLTWKLCGLALDKNDSYADRWFWAPEVYKLNGKYFMYYSADEHICVATADTPLGPFIQEKKEPMITNEKCIDNHLFIDEDGKPYLFFVRFNDGNNVWVAELDSDLTVLKKETMHHCIHVSQDWENIWQRVNEGPFVIKHNGIYYMTYSANSYESQFYGIGCATANNIEGTWIKYEDNPVLQNPGELVGVGHHSIFTDKDGKLRVAYHSHKDQNNIHPRFMHIGYIIFEGDKLKVSKEYITPELNL